LSRGFFYLCANPFNTLFGVRAFYVGPAGRNAYSRPWERRETMGIKSPTYYSGGRSARVSKTHIWLKGEMAEIVPIKVGFG
jgi:hypothetical protein